MAADQQSGKPSAMGGFSAAAQKWFNGAFSAPTAAQVQAWKAIRSGKNALVIAPTGSGKTLAAFMWAIDRLSRGPQPRDVQEGAPDGDRPAGDAPAEGVKVLYVSPLKALGVDVERNLRAPLAGIREAARSLGVEAPNISVGVRSGDTTPAERRRLLAHPPDVLITTPESLYLLLTSKGAETLRGVDTVIVDEVHALAGDKRGAHLALSLERLDALLEEPAQRIGLSATVEPAEEVARFLGGAQDVTIVRPKSEKLFDITIEVPVEDMTNPPVDEPEMVNANSAPQEHRLGSMWPSIEKSLYERIMSARSTIVFTNSRRLAERLTARLNALHEEQLEQEGESAELDEEQPVFARAHHGSVAKEIRADVEEQLKLGNLKCVVATASLELGIDMGDVDQVIQIDPPPSVASGLQRLGRSGHQVGGASRAIFYPTHRSKLIETAVIADRMQEGQIETLRVLSNPLDVLAQQTIAHTVAGPIDVDGWYNTVRRAAPFRDLPRSAYTSVLDLISGKYPSTDFATLRARVDWDRTAGTLTARPGAQRLAVTNGGTIPDRGMYRVVTGTAEEGGTRVGELDEEMVYETRVGEVFTLGTTPWRVRQITRDTVEVEPAFGVVAKTPFWRGDAPSRPVEIGNAVGELTSALATAVEPKRKIAKQPAGNDGGTGETRRTDVEQRLAALGLDQFAVENTLAYVREQLEAVGHLPTEASLVVERTRDDVGDWLFILLSPLGLAVHSPWSLAIDARLRDRWGLEGKSIPSNDGIIVRLPDFEDADDFFGDEVPRPATMPTAADIFLFEPDEISDLVREEVHGSAVFAARFREAAARALILGSSKPGKRSPLWQQRLRATSLLEVAAKYPDFPMILEALREVLQDVYDTGALARVMRELTSRNMAMVEVVTETPSPFARSLLFGYVGEFIYGGDTPAGERRLAALSVDPQVLRELLGEVPLADLLEARAVEEVEAQLQRTRPGWRARGVDGLVDLLRALGPLSFEELRLRIDPESDDSAPQEDPATDTAEEAPASAVGLQNLIDEATRRRQVFLARIGGHDYYAAIEDAGRLLATSGVVPPPGTPTSFLEAPADPMRDLIARHLRSNGPFLASDAATRFGVATATVEAALRNLEVEREALQGVFLPEELATAKGLTGDSRQWVARVVLDRMRTRSLALLRGTVEPVNPAVFARFLGQWQYCNERLRGTDGAYSALEQLGRLPLPASTWETLVLPERVFGYEPSMLDSLVTNGEVTWVGHGSIGARDGWVQFVPLGIAPRALPAQRPKTDTEQAILDELAVGGAQFAAGIHAGLGKRGLNVGPKELNQAMWSLVWDGLISSDSVAALRAHISGTRSAQKTVRARPRARHLTRRYLDAAAAGRQDSPNLTALDPSLVGRWSLVDQPPVSDATATLWAVEMLERYGVVTRGSVMAEDFPGGFAQAYRLYSDFEVSGTTRRGYYVQGLGGAQFAATGAVDQLRSIQEEEQKGTAPTTAITLAATDPANPYGAALPWPDALTEASGGAQPKRNAGALVTLVDGEPMLYVERGGKTVLASESIDVAKQALAASSLVSAARRGHLATFTVEKINGEPARESGWWEPLKEAGFSEVPRGLTLRRKIR